MPGAGARALEGGHASYSTWFRSLWGDPTELLSAHQKCGRAWTALTSSGGDVGPALGVLATALSASVPIDPPHVLKYVPTMLTGCVWKECGCSNPETPVVEVSCVACLHSTWWKVYVGTWLFCVAVA